MLLKIFASSTNNFRSLVFSLGITLFLNSALVFGTDYNSREELFELFNDTIFVVDDGPRARYQAKLRSLLVRPEVVAYFLEWLENPPPSRWSSANDPHEYHRAWHRKYSARFLASALPNATVSRALLRRLREEREPIVLAQIIESLKGELHTPEGEAFGPILALFQSDDPVASHELVRESCAKTLVLELHRPEVMEVYLRRAHGQLELSSSQEVVKALAPFVPGPRVVAALVHQLRNNGWDNVQRHAIEALRSLAHLPQVAEALQHLAQHAVHPEIRWSAFRALAGSLTDDQIHQFNLFNVHQ